MIIHCKLIKIPELKLANFMKKCIPGQNAHISHMEIGKLGVTYFIDFLRDSPMFTKCSVIN